MKEAAVAFLKTTAWIASAIAACIAVGALVMLGSLMIFGSFVFDAVPGIELALKHLAIFLGGVLALALAWTIAQAVFLLVVLA